MSDRDALHGDFPGDFDLDRDVGRFHEAEASDRTWFVGHRIGCFTDEGRLECCCPLGERP